MQRALPRVWRLAAAGLLATGLLLAAFQPAWADQVIHTVQPGENLYRIGLRYGVSWLAIVEANHLTNTVIYAGQQLVIPTTSGPATPAPPADPAAAPAPTAAPTQPPAPSPDPAANGTYTVQPGDYLSRIAQQFGVPVAELAAINHLADPSRIYPGQVLVIPGGGQMPAAPPAPAGAGASKQIVVDLSEQRMYVYQDGALIWTFVVSTGEPGRGTAAGTFSVLNKIDNAYGATWNIWMPNWLGIYWAGSLQNGIHALPILPGGGRLWDGYLGTRVSYGCVILGIVDAQTLYDWAEVGTPVIIQY
jgi:LysM repeat protein